MEEEELQAIEKRAALFKSQMGEDVRLLIAEVRRLKAENHDLILLSKEPITNPPR